MLAKACLFYVGMALVGWALWAVRFGPSESFDPWAVPSSVAWLAALIFVAGLHGLSRVALRHSRLMRQCVEDLGAPFAGWGAGRLAVLALVSAVGEEWFFRGWLMQEIGVVGSSLVFGMVHLPPKLRWWWWPFFAAAAGLFLAMLCLHGGGLAAAIAAHAGVNYLNLRLAVRACAP